MMTFLLVALAIGFFFKDVLRFGNTIMQHTLMETINITR